METIYVLRLQRGMYYVGKTGRSVEERYNEHQRGHGSAWTRLYAPVEVQEILESTSPFDEDRTVKEYMSEFGVNKVRGGSYSEIELNGETRRLLEREIRHAFGLCLNCGDRSHYRRNCPFLPGGPRGHSGQNGSSQHGEPVPNDPPHNQMR
jgi:predicted GIY-YIG superfamily endonuclease